MRIYSKPLKTLSIAVAIALLLTSIVLADYTGGSSDIGADVYIENVDFDADGFEGGTDFDGGLDPADDFDDFEDDAFDAGLDTGLDTGFDADFDTGFDAGETDRPDNTGEVYEPDELDKPDQTGEIEDMLPPAGCVCEECPCEECQCIEVCICEDPEQLPPSAQCECEKDCICEQECGCEGECICDEALEEKEEPKPEVTFVFDGGLVTEISELWDFENPDDLRAILLRGVRATNEDGEDVTHLITVIDDGGFAEHVQKALTPPEPPEQDRAGLMRGGMPDLEGIDRYYAWMAGLDEPQPAQDSAVDDNPGIAFDGQVIYAVTYPDSEEPFESEPRAVEIMPMQAAIPVTTFGQLQNAIAGAGNGGTAVIEIPAGTTINMDSTLLINQRNITITGGGTLTVDGNRRHFAIASGLNADFNSSQGTNPAANGTRLILAGDITLTRAASYTGTGGGINLIGRNSSVVDASSNRPVPILDNPMIIMRDNAAIVNNQWANGGGVHMAGGSLFMHDNSRIEHNISTGTGENDGGGGVSAASGGRCGVYMHDNSSISHNQSSRVAGGVRLAFIDELVMHGGAINGNTAGTDGGGVSTRGATSGVWFVVLYSGEIRNNTAGNNGGGIHILSSHITALFSTENVLFDGNSARTQHNYGLDRGLAELNLRWTGYDTGFNSLPGTHLLNNYDVTFGGGFPALLTVTFNGNGGTAQPIYTTRSVTSGGRLGGNMPDHPLHVSGVPNLFLRWTANANGTGGDFTSETAVTMNRTVFAQWRNVTLRTVTFHLNYAGAAPPEVLSVENNTSLGARMPANPERSNWNFHSWNIQPAGSGNAFTGATLVSANTNVHAQWDGVVTFDLNGGTGTQPPTRTVRENTSIGGLPDSEPTRPEYNFTGWNTEPGGTGTDFVPNALMTGGHVTYYAQGERIILPIVSLVRVPTDLLFHEEGSETVRISRWLDDVVTTIRSWAGEDGYTDDIVVRDTTAGAQNWRLELTAHKELTSLTNSARVLANALVYRNGGTTRPFGPGDTITVLSQQSVSNNYSTLNWSEGTGIFLNEDVSTYLDNLTAEQYQAEFIWTLVQAAP